MSTGAGTEQARSAREWTAVSPGARYRDRLQRAVVKGAGPVLYSPPDPLVSCGVVLCLAGLGSTKDKLAASKRSELFEQHGFACVLADHYNEGERLDKASEPLSNRAGWARSQKAHFWKAIHLTATTVPELVDFAMATYGAEAAVFAYGSSMGGDIFLEALCYERRLRAVVCERSTPDWLRPNSTANVLGESEDGDALYATHTPVNRLSDFVGHPTAVLFVLGASDTHVPRHGAEAFVEALHARGVDQIVLPSGGWEGHILISAETATREAIGYYEEVLGTAEGEGVGCSDATALRLDDLSDELLRLILGHLGHLPHDVSMLGHGMRVSRQWHAALQPAVSRMRDALAMIERSLIAWAERRRWRARIANGPRHRVHLWFGPAVNSVGAARWHAQVHRPVGAT